MNRKRDFKITITAYEEATEFRLEGEGEVPSTTDVLGTLELMKAQYLEDAIKRRGQAGSSFIRNHKN